MCAWKRSVKEAKTHKVEAPLRPFSAWSSMQFDPLVVQWIGISSDEVRRMKESQMDYIRHEWPLIDRGMSRKDCLAWMAGRGFPKPPRSACVFCPYHSDAEWLRLKTEEPEEFARAIAFYHAYRVAKIQTVFRTGFGPFLHSSRKPLDEVDFGAEMLAERGESVLGGGQFTAECEGICGV